MAPRLGPLALLALTGLFPETAAERGDRRYGSSPVSSNANRLLSTGVPEIVPEVRLEPASILQDGEASLLANKHGDPAGAFPLNNDFKPPPINDAYNCSSACEELACGAKIKQDIDNALKLGNKLSVTLVEDKLFVKGVVSAIASNRSGDLPFPIYQMPTLLSFQLLGSTVWANGNKELGNKDKSKIMPYLNNLLTQWPNFTFIVKPSHSTNGVGFIAPSKFSYHQNLESLTSHVMTFLSPLKRHQKSSLSVAAQKVTPGIIVEPEYPMPVLGQAGHVSHADQAQVRPAGAVPLELRVLAIWGRARFVVLWRGFKSLNNLWFQRDGTPVFLPMNDTLKREYEQSMTSNDFSDSVLYAAERDALIDHLQRFVPTVIAQGEFLGKKLGLPWGRFDFFVPPPGSDWKIALNEIEYNPGTQYMDFPAGEATLENLEAVLCSAKDRAWRGICEDVKPNGRDQLEVIEGRQVFLNLGCSDNNTAPYNLNCAAADPQNDASMSWHSGLS